MSVYWTLTAFLIACCVRGGLPSEPPCTVLFTSPCNSTSPCTVKYISVFHKYALLYAETADAQGGMMRWALCGATASALTLTHSAALCQSPPQSPPKPRRASPPALPLPPPLWARLRPPSAPCVGRHPNPAGTIGGLLRPGPHVRPPRASHAWSFWSPRPGRPGPHATSGPRRPGSDASCVCKRRPVISRRRRQPRR